MRFTALPSMLLRTAFAVMLTLLTPLYSQAVVLGEVTVHSALGQMLDADIEISALSATEAEGLTVKLASPGAFAEAGLDYTATLRSLRFRLEKKADRYWVHLSSDLAVSDPFLIFLLEVDANGNRTMRQYAVLLDPAPVSQDARAATNEPVTPILPSVSPAPEQPSAVADKPSQPANAKITPNEAPVESTAASVSENKRPSTRVVKRGETLAKIAAEVQTKNVSLEQVLIAFQRANPQAFDQQNIHRLKTGSVLRVPDTSGIQNVEVRQARQQVALQTADFHRYRSALGRSVGQTASTSDSAGGLPGDAANLSNRSNRTNPDKPGNRSSSASIGIQAPDKPSLTDTKDQLQLSAPGANAQSGTAGAAMEQIAKEQALKDAKSRIAELEKNVTDMQQQMTARNTSAARKMADTATPTLPNAASLKPPAETAVTLPADTSSVLTAPALITPTPAPVPAAVPPAASASIPNAPKRVAPAVPVTRTEDFAGRLESAINQWSRDPVPILSALGILLAGGLLLLLRRQMRKRTLTLERVEPNVAGQSVFGQAGGRNVDTSNSVFHSNFAPSISQLDANEVDAIAEADVYIAYGRDEQAEEILLDALKLHPDRHALRVKLLEIYASRKDSQKFGTLAADLRVLTHGQGTEWAQAAKMGQQLDPGNFLYGATLVSPNAPIKTASTDFNAQSNPGLSVSAAPASTSIDSVPVATERTLDLVRTDSSKLAASSVADFEIKLEGLLDERRKDADPALSMSPMSAFTETRPAMADFDLSGIARHGKSADSETLALNTKIDLALACQEIGDREGARELLAEVVSTRHPELAQRAQSLLQQLA